MNNKSNGLYDLKVYGEGVLLTKEIYVISCNQKIKQDFDLIRQIRRAALSIPANIAEGYGRKTSKDYSQYISIALGSANEVIAFLDCMEVIFEIDIKEVKNLLMTRYHSIKNVPNRSDGARPFYDLQTQSIVYLIKTISHGDKKY